MIEALAALSDSAGRMSIEPTATRKGLDEMAALLIAAHGLVAQLSAARLDARSGAPRGGRSHAGLASGAACADARRSRGAARPSGPLPSAALAVLEAAERYRRAARVESDEAVGLTEERGAEAPVRSRAA